MLSIGGVPTCLICQESVLTPDATTGVTPDICAACRKKSEARKDAKAREAGLGPIDDRDRSCPYYLLEHFKRHRVVVWRDFPTEAVPIVPPPADAHNLRNLILARSFLLTLDLIPDVMREIASFVPDVLCGAVRCGNEDCLSWVTPEEIADPECAAASCTRRFCHTRFCAACAPSRMRKRCDGCHKGPFCSASMMAITSQRNPVRGEDGRAKFSACICDKGEHFERAAAAAGIDGGIEVRQHARALFQNLLRPGIHSRQGPHQYPYYPAGSKAQAATENFTLESAQDAMRAVVAEDGGTALFARRVIWKQHGTRVVCEAEMKEMARGGGCAMWDDDALHFGAPIDGKRWRTCANMYAELNLMGSSRS